MSTVFRFSLQRVLELRRMREQARAIELAEAQGRAREALEACDRLAAARERVPLATAATTVSRPAGDLQGYAGVAELIGEHLRHSLERAAAAEREAADSLARFEESLRDRRVLDRLRERQHTDWLVEERRTDTQAMDALALTRHLRNNGDRS